MKILAIEKEVPGVADRQFTPTRLKSEAARVWELHQAGTIRELYFRQDRSEAVLVLECKDTKEASEILNTLPLVNQGLILFELIPLVAYPGFARLFNEPKEPER
jgi:muconolactone delta-isomerase